MYENITIKPIEFITRRGKTGLGGSYSGDGFDGHTLHAYMGQGVAGETAQTMYAHMNK
jgi:hypothetical protein